MVQSTELREAIEGLYQTFAGYPLRENTDACPCCHSPEDEKSLHRKELRKLGPEELEKYAMDALLVWGGVDDYKHFLPRIFELTTECETSFLQPPMVFNKLYHGEWWGWPENEQHSVERFLNALWRGIIDGPGHEFYGSEIEEWICGIAQAVPDLSPFLNLWLTLDTENSSLNLARFIIETEFVKSDRPLNFWGDRRELFDQVVQWVRGEAVRSKIRAIATRYGQYDFVELAHTLIV
jgi:hypothetical protein